MALNQKQRLFVEAFDGDVVNSLRAAGYSGADSYLKNLGEGYLKDPLIQEAIKHRSKYIETKKRLIATREERQELWSRIMKNEDPYQKEEVDENNVPIRQPKNLPLPLRLKASELLGKSEADFVEKVDMNVQHSLSDLIMQSYQLESKEDIPIEAIEAEYYRVKKAGEKPEDFEVVTPEESKEQAPQTLDDLI